MIGSCVEESMARVVVDYNSQKLKNNSDLNSAKDLMEVLQV